MADAQYDKMLREIEKMDYAMNRAMAALMEKYSPSSLTEDQLNDFLAILGAHRIPVDDMQQEWADEFEDYCGWARPHER